MVKRVVVSSILILLVISSFGFTQESTPDLWMTMGPMENHAMTGDLVSLEIRWGTFHSWVQYPAGFSIDSVYFEISTTHGLFLTSVLDTNMSFNFKEITNDSTGFVRRFAINGKRTTYLDSFWYLTTLEITIPVIDTLMTKMARVTLDSCLFMTGHFPQKVDVEGRCRVYIGEDIQFQIPMDVLGMRTTSIPVHHFQYQDGGHYSPYDWPTLAFVSGVWRPIWHGLYYPVEPYLIYFNGDGLTSSVWTCRGRPVDFIVTDAVKGWWPVAVPYSKKGTPINGGINSFPVNSFMPVAFYIDGGQVCVETDTLEPGRAYMLPVTQDCQLLIGSFELPSCANNSLAKNLSKKQVLSQVEADFGKLDLDKFYQIMGINMLDGAVESIPNNFELHQNYPNPFNPVTTIQYNLPADNHVELVIYDVNGRKVAELVSEQQTAGDYKTEWNATELPSGIYFCRIQAGDFVSSRRMILLK